MQKNIDIILTLVVGKKRNILIQDVTVDDNGEVQVFFIKKPKEGDMQYDFIPSPADEERIKQYLPH